MALAHLIIKQEISFPFRFKNSTVVAWLLPSPIITTFKQIRIPLRYFLAQSPPVRLLAYHLVKLRLPAKDQVKLLQDIPIVQSRRSFIFYLCVTGSRTALSSRRADTDTSQLNALACEWSIPSQIDKYWGQSKYDTAVLLLVSPRTTQVPIANYVLSFHYGVCKPPSP